MCGYKCHIVWTLAYLDVLFFLTLNNIYISINIYLTSTMFAINIFLLNLKFILFVLNLFYSHQVLNFPTINILLLFLTINIYDYYCSRLSIFPTTIVSGHQYLQIVNLHRLSKFLTINFFCLSLFGTITVFRHPNYQSLTIKLLDFRIFKFFDEQTIKL